MITNRGTKKYSEMKYKPGKTKAASPKPKNKAMIAELRTSGPNCGARFCQAWLMSVRCLGAGSCKTQKVRAVHRFEPTENNGSKMIRPTRGFPSKKGSITLWRSTNKPIGSWSKKSNPMFDFANRSDSLAVAASVILLIESYRNGIYDLSISKLFPPG